MSRAKRGGVKRSFWIAALAAFVLVEKVAPSERWLARVAGVLLVAWGTFVLVTGSMG